MFGDTQRDADISLSVMVVRMTQKDKMNPDNKAKTQEDILREGMPNQTTRRNQIRISVVLDQFPFIRQVIRDKVLAHIIRSGKEIPLQAVDLFLSQTFVSRLTEEIILRVPCRNADGHGEVVFFLDSNGEVIAEEVQPEPWRLRLFIICGPVVKEWKAMPWYHKMKSSAIRFRGKCLGDILQAFGNLSDKVAFALSYDTRTTSIILYRRVKGMKLVDWMTDYEERTLARAREELQRELAQE